MQKIFYVLSISIGVVASVFGLTFFSVIVLSSAGRGLVSLHDIETAATRDDPQPVFLLECNNMAGQAWLSKGCTSSATGRALARLQASLLLNQGAGYRFGRVDTKTNVIADGISCIPSELSLSREFPLLLAQAPSLHGCRHYNPNAALILSIMDVLLRNNYMDPLSVSRQLLTNPGNFTS
jgi:hypothetical protein